LNRKQRAPLPPYHYFPPLDSLFSLMSATSRSAQTIRAGSYCERRTPFFQTGLTCTLVKKTSLFVMPPPSPRRKRGLFKKLHSRGFLHQEPFSRWYSTSPPPRAPSRPPKKAPPKWLLFLAKGNFLLPLSLCILFFFPECLARASYSYPPLSQFLF